MYIWIDVETGGLDPKSGNVLQIGAIVTNTSLNVLDSFDSYCKPINQEQIEHSALKVNKLTLEDIERFDDWRLVQARFLEFIKKQGFFMRFCAFNAAFDWQFLSSWMSYNPSCSEWKNHISEINFLDPLKIAKKLKSGGVLKTKNLKLETLCDYFGIKNKNSHDAVGDITATIEVYKKIKELLPVKDLSFLEKRRKYLDSYYVMLNSDGEIYIKDTALSDKDCMEFLLKYLWIRTVKDV